MPTPTYLDSAGYSNSLSAASYGGGAQSPTVTCNLSDLTTSAPDSRYAILIAASQIVEPAATTPPTITPSAGWTLLAEHDTDVASGSDQWRNLLKVYGAPISAFPLTVTWAFTNTNFSGRFNSAVVGYKPSCAPLSISAPDLDGVTLSGTTGTTTLGAPARKATVLQVTMAGVATGTTPTVNTANGFTSRILDGGFPEFALLDQQDVAGATDYATIDTGSTGARWITVGAALGGAGGIYVDGAIHI